MEFDQTKAQTYRKRALVRAYKADCAATYFKSWAGEKGQVMDGPHMVMIPLDAHLRPMNEVYGCAMTEFEETYTEDFAASGLDVYKKTATIEAYQPGVAFDFQTVMKSGHVEIPEGKGTATDWFIRNPSGECYALNEHEFLRTYTLA